MRLLLSCKGQQRGLLRCTRSRSSCKYDSDKDVTHTGRIHGVLTVYPSTQRGFACRRREDRVSRNSTLSSTLSTSARALPSSEAALSSSSVG